MKGQFHRISRMSAPGSHRQAGLRRVFAKGIEAPTQHPLPAVSRPSVIVATVAGLHDARLDESRRCVEHRLHVKVMSHGSHEHVPLFVAMQSQLHPKESGCSPRRWQRGDSAIHVAGNGHRNAERRSRRDWRRLRVAHRHNEVRRSHRGWSSGDCACRGHRQTCRQTARYARPRVRCGSPAGSQRRRIGNVQRGRRQAGSQYRQWRVGDRDGKLFRCAIPCVVAHRDDDGIGPNNRWRPGNRFATGRLAGAQLQSGGQANAFDAASDNRPAVGRHAAGRTQVSVVMYSHVPARQRRRGNRWSIRGSRASRDIAFLHRHDSCSWQWGWQQHLRRLRRLAAGKV